MTLLNPISWSKQNAAILIGGCVFGIVEVVLNFFHLNVVLGIGHAIAFVLAMWAIAAYHALKGTPAQPLGSQQR